MKATVARLGVSFVALSILPGCLLAPKTELNAALAQNRALTEQNRAQLTEIENLKSHNREIEDRLIQSEEQLSRRTEPANAEAASY